MNVWIGATTSTGYSNNYCNVCGCYYYGIHQCVRFCLKCNSYHGIYEECPCRCNHIHICKCNDNKINELQEKINKMKEELDNLKKKNKTNTADFLRKRGK